MINQTNNVKHNILNMLCYIHKWFISRWKATSAATLGIIDTGFSLFLRDSFGEDFSEFKIGLLFLPSSISYVLAGFLIGYLTDQR